MMDAMPYGEMVQTIAISVYLVVSVAAAAIAFVNRSAFGEMLGEKSAAPSESGALPASFSRVVGLVGTIFLTVFIWCAGLYLLAGVVPTTGPFIDIEKYIVVAATLFAPYAANQLAQLFGTKAVAPSTAATGDTDAKPIDLSKVVPHRFGEGKMV